MKPVSSAIKEKCFASDLLLVYLLLKRSSLFKKCFMKPECSAIKEKCFASYY